MIKIPKEHIIEKIKEKTKLSDKEIKAKVKDKMDLLSGLISEEGAMHIIANELGVKLFETSGKLQIKNVLPGMRSVDLEGKVINKYEIRSFEKESRKGKVGSFLLGDSTGRLRVTAWNDKADLLEKLNEGALVKIENGYSKENNGRVEVHLGDKSTVVILKEQAPDIEVKETERERKKIKDLTENLENVEIMGTIVQAFEPKFFDTCPECNKKLKQIDEGYYCDTHSKVTPAVSYVMNLILDDGTETIRVVLWKSQAQKLLNKSHEEIASKKGSSFDEEKTDLLGKIVKFAGRTSKNEMFQRIEFIPQLVFPNPNPEEEIERLNSEIESAKGAEKDTEPEIPVISGQDTAGEEADEDISGEDIEEIMDMEESSVKMPKEKKAPEKKANKAHNPEDLLEEIDSLDELDNI